MDNKEQKIFLQKLYNTLSLIPTQGQGTIHMAECLNAIYNNILLLSKEEYTTFFDLDNIINKEEEKENG